MGEKKFSTKYPGVRYTEQKSRKMDAVSPDRKYYIRFTIDGNDREFVCGWHKLGGWTALKAATYRAEFINNIQTGEGPRTPVEKREIAERKRAEAEKARREAELRNLIFEDFFIDVYFPIARRDKKNDTWRAEIGHFKNWIQPVIGQKPMSDVCNLDIHRIKSDMQKAGRSPRTIEYALATVRRVFNVAAYQGYFKGMNPVKGVRIDKPDNRRHRWFRPEETALLLDALKKRNRDAHDAALLALDCGLRSGEIRKLKWDCIDFDSGLIAVLGTKNRENRHVNMTADVRAMLENRFDPDGGYVLPGKWRDRLNRIPKPYFDEVEKLGLNDGVTDHRGKAGFHTLRHTFATWLVRAGVDLFTVKNLLGHKDISMTMRYAHHAPDKGADAAARIDAIKKEGGNIVDLAERRAVGDDSE